MSALAFVYNLRAKARWQLEMLAISVSFIFSERIWRKTGPGLGFHAKLQTYELFSIETGLLVSSAPIYVLVSVCEFIHPSIIGTTYWYSGIQPIINVEKKKDMGQCMRKRVFGGNRFLSEFWENRMERRVIFFCGSIADLVYSQSISRRQEKRQAIDLQQ